MDLPEKWTTLSRDLASGLIIIGNIDDGIPQLNRAVSVNHITEKVKHLAHSGEAELVEHALTMIRHHNARHQLPAFPEDHEIWDLRRIAWDAKERLEKPGTVVGEVEQGAAIEEWQERPGMIR